MVSMRHSMEELQRSGALKHIKESAVSKTLTLDDDDDDEEGGEVMLKKLRDLLREEMERASATAPSSSSSSSKGLGWFREE